PGRRLVRARNAAVAYAQRPAQAREHLRTRQRAARPGEVDLESPARAQSTHLPARPRCRQRRQELQLAGVALHQHLDDPCRRAEVAVDLEGRMRIEEVRIDTPSAVLRARAAGEGEQVVE